MKTDELLEETTLLPLKERVFVADAIPGNLHSRPGIDRKWGEVAKQRLAELYSGEVKVIPGEIVFRQIWERF